MKLSGPRRPLWATPELFAICFLEKKETSEEENPNKKHDDQLSFHWKILAVDTAQT